MNPSEARARMAVRLRQANLGTERFIDVMDGSKTSNNHQEREPSSPKLSGNYGVYPGRGGNPEGGYLVDIDVDDYDGEYNTDALDSLPDTFEVESPHGGVHRYYALDGSDPVAVVKDAVNVRNPVPTWGEIRVQNGYVVGPGSELHSCDKEWHDCSNPDEGDYHISENRPIATISTDHLAEVVRADPNYYEEYQQMTFGEND